MHRHVRGGEVRKHAWEDGDGRRLLLGQQRVLRVVVEGLRVDVCGGVRMQNALILLLLGLVVQHWHGHRVRPDTDPAEGWWGGRRAVLPRGATGARTRSRRSTGAAARTAGAGDTGGVSAGDVGRHHHAHGQRDQPGLLHGSAAFLFREGQLHE